MRYLRYDAKREKIWYEMIKLENEIFLTRRNLEYKLFVKRLKYIRICRIIKNGL
jgi:hypothetical protein